jgi:hypothetical protein
MNNIDITDYLYTNEEMEELYRSSIFQYKSKYNLDELVEKTKSLNDLNFNLETNKSIAVVGNSGTLMEKEYGEFIDNHDIVIRCNHGRIEGFEKNVGSKTDFRFVSGKGFWYGKVMDETYSNYDHNFLTNLKNQRMIIKAIPMYSSLQGIIKHYDTKSYVHFLRESFVKDSEDLSGVGNSTLGFTAICFAVQFSKKISIFGFGFFKEDWDKQHYFENIKPKNRDHTFDDEEEYVNFLRAENILEIYK